MRRSLAARVRIAAATVAVAVVAGVMGLGAPGCNSAGSVSASDAGEDLSVMPLEGGEDSPATTGVDAGLPVVFPRLYVVNASPDGPPLRFCLGLVGGAVGGGLPAAPDVPAPGFPLAGVYPGYGAPLDDHGIDLAELAFVLFGLDATNPLVAAATSAAGLDASADGGTDASLEAPCEALIGPDGLGTSSDAGGVLQPGRDFWRLATFAPQQ